MRTFVCDSFFLFFVFCFLVPLRGTENLHKSIHLQSILLGTQNLFSLTPTKTKPWPPTQQSLSLHPTS